METKEKYYEKFPIRNASIGITELQKEVMILKRKGHWHSMSPVNKLHYQELLMIENKRLSRKK